MIVSPPQIVGSEAIADILGRTRWWVARSVIEGRRPYTVGYIGKIAGRHCWDLNQFLDGAVDSSCRVCDDAAGIVGLCPEHAVAFVNAWDRSHRSRSALIQFVAMCRWVVERYADVDAAVGDVWSSVCATPDCDGIPLDGPLCEACLSTLRGRLAPDV